MWPLISPASGACSSFILALISEWPVFHITGSAPASSSAAGRTSEHFTSKMTGVPGPNRCTASRPKMTSSWSPQMIWPVSSTAPIRSASPSNAMPSSAPVRRTAAWRSSRFSGTVGSGWWLGKVPSDSQKSGVTSAPSAWSVETAITLPDAVAAVGDHLDPAARACAARRSPRGSAAAPSCRWSPCPSPLAPPLGGDDLPEAEDLVAVKGLAAEHHLEAVELGRIVGAGDLDAARRSPARRPRSRAPGVGSVPTSTAVPPASAIPSRTPWESAGPDGPVVPPDRDHRRAADPLPGDAWRRRGRARGRTPGSAPRPRGRGRRIAGRWTWERSWVVARSPARPCGSGGLGQRPRARARPDRAAHWARSRSSSTTATRQRRSRRPRSG